MDRWTRNLVFSAVLEHVLARKSETCSGNVVGVFEDLLNRLWRKACERGSRAGKRESVDKSRCLRAASRIFFALLRRKFSAGIGVEFAFFGTVNI